METTAFILGWHDGYTNAAKLSQSPEYRAGYVSGVDDRMNDEYYWKDEETLAIWARAETRVSGFNRRPRIGC